MSDSAHKPVLLTEVLAALKPKPGGRYADGTLGQGGSRGAPFWPRVRRTAGCTDAIAIARRLKRFGAGWRGFAGRFEIRRGNFADLADWVPPGSCDGVLLDLGVSSAQLDESGRGFSFQNDGPLDMRMDTEPIRDGGGLANTASAEELAKIFWEFGGERNARRLARAIVEARQNRRLETTRQLAELIEQAGAAPRKKSASGDESFSSVADRGER